MTTILKDDNDRLMMQLKNGQVTYDSRLDRVVQFDERSRAFPIRELVPKKQRSYTWRCDEWLDQGREGACVGFAWAHDMAARPKVIVTNTQQALLIYREAQRLDEWPGEAYSGTSVLAGAKVVSKLGYMPQYRWAFGLDDLILAVGYAGPAVLGINWYEGMYDTDAKGYIHPTGQLMGGHAILCHSVNIPGKYFVLHNSWGKDNFGVQGKAKISFDDMGRLLHEQGEACVPVVRALVR